MNFKALSGAMLLFSNVFLSQKIINEKTLQPFIHKIKTPETTSQILFLGDSHIQSGWITGYLREQFQTRYGNAGRGMIFPYAVANSNGPDDYTSSSTTTWESFRLVYEQDIFPTMGAAGFVMGTHQPSLIEIRFKNTEEAFNKLIIFHDEKMQGQTFELLHSEKSLANYVQRKSKRVSYQIQQGDTFPELAAKFYTTTTKLKALNGASVQNPKPGTWIKADDTSIDYNNDFENQSTSLMKTTFQNGQTIVSLPKIQHHLLLKTHSDNSIFYGFQLLNEHHNGIVFNTVGVNGATYKDFMKYPLQFEQLKTLHPDFLIIALGTNEAVSPISEEEFKNNASQLIGMWRQTQPNLPILLISPPDNELKPQKTKQVSKWIEEIANEHHIAFFDLHEAMGGLGYFKRALKRNEANKDKVHFLKSGYEAQARKIWEALETELMND